MPSADFWQQLPKIHKQINDIILFVQLNRTLVRAHTHTCAHTHACTCRLLFQHASSSSSSRSRGDPAQSDCWLWKDLTPASRAQWPLCPAVTWTALRYSHCHSRLKLQGVLSHKMLTLGALSGRALWSKGLLFRSSLVNQFRSDKILKVRTPKVSTGFEAALWVRGKKRQVI